MNLFRRVMRSHASYFRLVYCSSNRMCHLEPPEFRCARLSHRVKWLHNQLFANFELELPPKCSSNGNKKINSFNNDYLTSKII